MDARRQGQHGIARFGHEVVGRLRTSTRRLGGIFDPLSPLDALNPDRLRLRSADVIFSPGFHAGPTRARQLLTLHDLIQLEDPVERDTKKLAYYRYVVRPAVRRAGRVLTVSPTSQRVVENWLGGSLPVIDVGNGCSDLFFSSTGAERRSGLLYVGALKPHKNPEIVFEALALQPALRLTVITSDVDDVERFAARHGVADRVEVRSRVSDGDLARLYASAAALVIPSLSEGFGLPAAEALASNCPVIYWSGCAAVAEIAGADGRAVDDAHDAAAWAAAISAAEETDLRVDARERIRDRYSWDAVAARIDEQIDLTLRN